MAGASVWDAPGAAGAWRPPSGSPGRRPSSGAGGGAIFGGGTPSRSRSGGFGRSSSSGAFGAPRGGAGAGALRRLRLPTAEHGVAVALHPERVAVVLASSQDTVVVFPLPREAEGWPDPSPSSSSSAPPPGAGEEALCHEEDGMQLRAPSGPLRALRFAEATGPTVLVAMAVYEAFVWHLEAPSPSAPPPGPPLRLVGVEAIPPTLPSLAFDESGAIVALAGSDSNGGPLMLAFHTRDGSELARAEVPQSRSRAEEDEDSGGSASVTSCCFLRGDFAFGLVAAVHDGGKRGQVLVYDMRGCGAGAGGGALVRPAHEAAGPSLVGAPFAALAPHEGEGSSFVLGGEGVVHVMQVRETSGGGLTCAHLTEVSLTQEELPCWLRPTAPGGDEAGPMDSPGSSPGGWQRPGSAAWRGGGGGIFGGGGGGLGGGGGGPVLALAATSCRCPGGGSSASALLELRGTAALAVGAGGDLLAVWGHTRRAEPLPGGATASAVGAAAACAAPGEGGELLAAWLPAFAGGGEVLRFSLPPDLVLTAGAAEAPLAAAAAAEDGEPMSGDPMADLLRGLALGSGDEDLPDEPPICSVLPLGPIPDDSALGRALAPKRPAGSAPSSSGGASSGAGRPPAGGGSGGALRRAGSAPLRDRGGQAAPRAGAGSNQPVTFHRKVKSAGYGPSSEPPRVPGRPKLSTSSSAAAARAAKPDFGPPTPSRGSRPPRGRSVGGPGGGRGGALAMGYAASGPPLEPAPEHTLVAYEGSAALDVRYAPLGSHLVVAGSDRTIAAYKLPLGSGSGNGGPRPLALTGHQADVTSLCPSYTDSHSTGGGGSPLLLSSSAGDKTARLWSLGGPYAAQELICFDRLRTSTKQAHREENPSFEQVQDAQFLCLDGALAIATGNRVGIYRYELHVQDSHDDIRRLQRLGTYKCCGLLSLPREPGIGHSVVAVAANNTVLSGTLLVAASSKRVYAWDAGAEKVLARLEETSLHTRPITCLRLAQPHSEYQSAQSMDLFYSSAMDGTVKLWDLRTMQECRTFQGAHVHACQKLRCCLSPCLRYMCTPSEDGGVCVYDVRTGNVLGFRQGHRDVASAVDMHPRTGTLVSCGFDGKVKFQRPPAKGKPPKAQGRPPGGIRQREAPTGLKEVAMDMS